MDDQGLLEHVRPSDIEAEKSVLGSILRDPECLTEVSAKLRSEDFYLPRHRGIYEILLALDQRSSGAGDPVTVAHEIERTGRNEELGGRTYIEELMFSVPSLAFLENHVGIVRDLAVRRSLLAATEKIQRTVAEGSLDVKALIDQAEQDVFKVGDRMVGGELFSAKDLVEKNLNLLLSDAGPPEGLQTGFADLDERQGFRPGDLVVLAARPSMGKTAFALNILERVVLSGKTALLFSLEMPAEQIIMRMLSSHSKVKHDKVRKGKLNPTDEKRLIISASQLASAPLFIDDSSQPSLAEIRAKARRLKRDSNLELVVVDYLQLLSVHKAESRQQEISTISRNLKAMARDLKVPVLALAQLNRKAEDRTDHRPMLSDLRESGAIEQDADLVMMLFRDEYYKREESEKAGLADIIVAKNRNGATGDVTLRYTKELMRFENAVTEPSF